MILAQPELRAAVAAGKIKFNPPLEEKQWGEASVDLRLGTQFTRLKKVPGLKISLIGGLSQLTGFWDTMELPERDAFGKLNAFCLDPDEFILAMTYESITVPRNMIALVEGRSTYARLGLSMHQTAPWIQPGWSGRIVLEIKNLGPAKVELTPILDRPCQLTFFELSSALPERLAYGSKSQDSYKDQLHPLEMREAKTSKKTASSDRLARLRKKKNTRSTRRRKK
jgi:dCTP deaminase